MVPEKTNTIFCECLLWKLFFPLVILCVNSKGPLKRIFQEQKEEKNQWKTQLALTKITLSYLWVSYWSASNGIIVKISPCSLTSGK